MKMKKMKNEKLLDEFEIVWNTKHEIKVKFIVPIGKRRWWEFWKEKKSKTIIELSD